MTLTKFNVGLMLLFLLCTGNALASQQSQIPAHLNSAQGNNNPVSENAPLSTAGGLVMLDYELVPLSESEDIDLLGVHYLHQLNDWLYLGIGLSGPMVFGDYGGFFVLGSTIHAQKTIFSNFFVDAGLSLGGGGGGSTVEQSKELSGTGGYIKTYLGFGYDFHNFNAGVNYSHVQLTNSIIDHSQLNFYIQRPLEFSVGSFVSSGEIIGPTNIYSSENTISLELNNIYQIKPTGSYRGSIGTLSPHISHFITNNDYIFFGFDVGYKGLRWYNQVQGGVGRRLSVLAKVNLYGQLGIGSGGYAPEKVETGSGLLIYPKLSAEYLLSHKLGISLTTGFLLAPKGTSKNLTLGAAVSYHFSSTERSRNSFNTEDDLVLRGFRVNLFPQVLLDVEQEEEQHHNINMLSLQFDYNVSDYFFIPFQLSAANNDFYGYPGYVEILTGLGLQSKFLGSKSTQLFFQILFGENAIGGIVKSSIGLNYSLNEDFAIFGQLGRTISLNEYIKPEYDVAIANTSIGLGLTYRFSLPLR